MSEALVFEALPLSAEQRALDSLPGPAAVLLTVTINGACDGARLHAAVAAVTARHTQLRSALCTVAGYRGLRQQVQELPLLAATDWREVDLCAATDTDAALAAAINEQRHTAFELASGRLWRARLFRLAPQRWCLSFAVARVAADRHSLQAIYQALPASYADPAAAWEEPLQYPQFVEWRRDLEQGEFAASGRAYWQQLLAQQAPALRLPYRQDEHHNARQEYAAESDAQSRHANADYRLPPALATSLVRLATAQEQTVASLIQAAWWALLARIGEQPLFAAGWQHDCRYDYDMMLGAVGVFEKILPLAIDVAPQESFQQWSSRFAAILDAHVQAQEYAPVAAPPSDAHLVAGFMLAQAPVAITADGLQFDCSTLPHAADVFALAAQLQVDAAGLPVALSLRHSAAYSSAAVQRLLQQFVTLLTALETHAAQPVQALPLIGAVEQAALMALNSAATAPLPVCVPDQIAAWAQTSPEAIALQADALTLSYAQLDEQVNRLAHYLRAHGVERDRIVALRMPRCGALVVALLAVMRAGGAYLPVDPAWPQARQQAILKDAAPVLLLTDQAHADDATESVEAGALPQLVLEHLVSQLASLPVHASTSATIPALDPTQAAYVLYTSGSTGAPKGVVIEHRQLANYAAAASQALDLASLRSFALTSTVAADLGNTSLFGALVNGARLVVASAAEMQDAGSFAAFIAARSIDCIKIVPSHLEALLDAQPGALPATIVLGGEAATRRLLERIHAQSPATRVFNHYGPTETTIGVMTHAVDFAAPLPESLPLTHVMAHCRVVLLDAHAQLAPTGTLGELYVGGAQLCRGYLGQATHASFIDDPVHPGERLYRTGDLARYLPEGGLQLAGRADHQLKVRGFRIEAGEVEQALLSLSGIRAARVGLHGLDQQRRLTAWVVAERDDSERWNSMLQELLPDVMVPSAIVVLAEMPRLGNGKIDVQALPAPQQRAVVSHVAPRNPLEALLAGLFADMLACPPVSIDADFFALGGHSLLVIKLVGRLRKALQIEIAPGLVFDHPNVAELAQALLADEVTPGRLQQIAAMRQQLAGMTEQERAALQQDALA